MVLLTTAAAFALLGLVVFVVGLAMDRPELAMFGAIVMIGIGGTGMVDGYQVETGETKEVTDNITFVASDEFEVSTHVQTKDVSSEDLDPTGIEFSELGDFMYISGNANNEIFQYRSGSWDLATATFERSFDVSGETTAPVGVEFSPDGTLMYVTADGTLDSIITYELSEPYNVSTAAPNGQVLDVSAQTTTPRAIDLTQSGDQLYVVSQGDSHVEQYNLNESYNVSSATFQKEFDVSSQLPDPTGIDFSADGTLMVLTGETADRVFHYELATGYDLDTAAYTGDSLDISGQVGRATGIAYEDDGRKLFVTDDLGSTAEQYNTSEREVVTVETTETQYTDVDTISSFPLELVVLLLGAIMLIGASGEASEQGRDDPPWRRR